MLYCEASDTIGWKERRQWDRGKEYHTYCTAHSVCCFLVEKNEMNEGEEGPAWKNYKGNSKRSSIGFKQKTRCLL